MTTLQRVAKAALNTAASAALLLASANFAVALTVTGEATAKPAVTRGEVISFNWLAGKSTPRKSVVVPATARVNSGLNLGGGSYVCSPAGFGRQSRCFSR